VWRDEPLESERRLTVNADPELWDAWAASGAASERLSLEDIFISCVGARRMQV
jgi:hypothetical protein